MHAPAFVLVNDLLSLTIDNRLWQLTVFKTTYCAQTPSRNSAKKQEASSTGRWT